MSIQTNSLALIAEICSRASVHSFSMSACTCIGKSPKSFGAVFSRINNNLFTLSNNLISPLTSKSSLIASIFTHLELARILKSSEARRFISTVSNSSNGIKDSALSLKTSFIQCCTSSKRRLQDSRSFSSSRMRRFSLISWKVAKASSIVPQATSALGIAPHPSPAKYEVSTMMSNKGAARHTTSFHVMKPLYRNFIQRCYVKL